MDRIYSNDPDRFKKLYPDNEERQRHLNYLVKVRKIIHDNKKADKGDK